MVIPEHVGVQIPLKVLRGDDVVNAVDAAFGVAPKAFDVVGVGAAGDVFFGPMTDRFVGIAQTGQPVVSPMFVGEHGGGFRVNVVLDHRKQGGGAVVGFDLNHRIALALYQPDDGSFADRPTPGVEFLGFVLVLFLAADVGFVNLDFPEQLQSFLLGHQLADLGEHSPRRFVGDTSFPLELFCRYACPGGRHEEHRVEPGAERRTGFVEDGAGSGGDVGTTPGAGIDLPPFDAMVGRYGVALGAVNTVRPASVFDVLQAGAIVGELTIEVFERVLFHVPMILETVRAVKG